jgi:transposase
VDIPESTLTRWVSQLEDTGHAISVDKKSGRKASLGDEEKRLMIGFILDQNEKNQRVKIATVQTFLRDEVGVELGKTAVQQYITNCGFSSQKLKTKSKGYTLDMAALVDIAWEWLNCQWISGVLNTPRERICSIDLVFTGHRTDHLTGYRVKGLAQGKAARSISRFTNCNVTLVWADGVNRTPAVLYTLNADFRRDRSATARRSRLVAHLETELRKNRLDPERVVYVGKDTHEKRTKVGASTEIIRRFLQKYAVDPSWVIFSDNGNEFLGLGEEFGFERHVLYPKAVHQFLSPNDNHLHGAAKQAWRAGRDDFSDDVAACCELLHHLDVHSEQAAQWFTQNLQLGSQRPSRELVQRLITGDSGSKHAFFRECLVEYRIWARQDVRGSVPEVVKKLRSDLDGRNGTEGVAHFFPNLVTFIFADSPH